MFVRFWMLTIPTCIILCNGASNSEGMDSFKSGTYKIKNFASASEMAKKMNVLKLHYSGFQRRSFVIAMVDMFSNPRFSFPEFIAKLKAFPSLMINCQDKKAYMDRIELIYNYKRREKVNLRF